MRLRCPIWEVPVNNNYDDNYDSGKKCHLIEMASRRMSGEILTLPGSLALSESRAQRISNLLGATSVRALWIHYVHVNQPLSSLQRTELTRLLDDGCQPPRDALTKSLLKATRGEATGFPGAAVYFITPRAGTISPWSSQATLIAQRCGGLDGVISRIERGSAIVVITKDNLKLQAVDLDLLFDRMREELSESPPDTSRIFQMREPATVRHISLFSEPGSRPSAREGLEKANNEYGLALDQSEIDYLLDAYLHLNRNPTDVELFMFAQINSEHCRHKQFNATWIIDGEKKTESLFDMIRYSHRSHSEYVISAYSDNAAVFEGPMSQAWAPDPNNREYKHGEKEQLHILGKVETHNHPTAVSPFPGAATGAGGEIRDEGAVGRGSRPKAGITGFSVSELRIPGFEQPWELGIGKPSHIADGNQIMIQAPIGSASYNNEFGRPCTAGYFRTYLALESSTEGAKTYRGYHKPIMIAGGVGSVKAKNALKNPDLVTEGAHLVILGGPAMLIGLGGGAASSVQSGDSSAELDFASVQRGNC